MMITQTVRYNPDERDKCITHKRTDEDTIIQKPFRSDSISLTEMFTSQKTPEEPSLIPEKNHTCKEIA